MDRQGLEQVIWTGRQGPFFLWLGVRDKAGWVRAWQGQVTPQTPERALLLEFGTVCMFSSY